MSIKSAPKTKPVCLEQLLEKVHVAQEPKHCKEILLGITQLYFDGLVERGPHTLQHWPAQERALCALFDANKQALSAFYKRCALPLEEISDTLKPHERTILASALAHHPKKRYLANLRNEVKHYATLVNCHLADRGITRIVAIASGAFEPALIASMLLNNAPILPVRYSVLSRKDADVKLPLCAPKDYAWQLTDETILIVDDVVSLGATLQKVYAWTKNHKPKKTYVAIVDALRSDTLASFFAQTFGAKPIDTACKAPRIYECTND